MVTEEQRDALISSACEVRHKAYAPYSNYLVGAAILAGNGGDAEVRSTSVRGKRKLNITFHQDGTASAQFSLPFALQFSSLPCVSEGQPAVVE